MNSSRQKEKFIPWVFYRKVYASTSSFPYTHHDLYSFKLRVSLENKTFLNEEIRQTIIKYLNEKLPRHTFLGFKIVNPDVFTIQNPNEKEHEFIEKFTNGGQFTIYIRNDYHGKNVLKFIIELEEYLSKLRLEPGQRLGTDLDITRFIQIRLERYNNHYISSRSLLRNGKRLAANHELLKKSYLYKYLKIDQVIIGELNKQIKIGKDKKKKANGNTHSRLYKKGDAIVNHASHTKTMVKTFFDQKDKQIDDYVAFGQDMIDHYRKAPPILKESTGWGECAAFTLNVIMVLTMPIAIGGVALSVKKALTGSFFFNTKTKTETSFNRLQTLSKTLQERLQFESSIKVRNASESK